MGLGQRLTLITVLLAFGAQAWADRAVVKIEENSQANVRSKPCVESEVTGTLDPNAQVIVEKWKVTATCGEGEWVKVRAGSVKGYMARMLLERPVQSARGSIYKPGGKATLYRDACAASDVLLELPHGTSLLLVLQRGFPSDCGASGPYAKITVHGEIGYVLEQDLLVESTTESIHSDPPADAAH